MEENDPKLGIQITLTEKDLQDLIEGKSAMWKISEDFSLFAIILVPPGGTSPITPQGFAT